MCSTDPTPTPGTKPAAFHPAPGEPDAAEAFAAHLARVGYADLPAAVVAATKASILDTIACALAGTVGEEVASIQALVAKWGGQATSTVIGAGGLKVPAASAVLANGSTIHQYDFDDTHDTFVCHPTSASLIPALALAEEIGGVSGKDLITAVALANDLTCRVAGGIRGKISEYPWFRAPVVGIFGATAASAKILGATREQHLEALGLTLPQVCGTFASLHHHGSSMRSIRDGVVYRNGVLAAELAMRGVRGDKEVFDGPYGYYQAYYRGEHNREAFIGDLGRRYETARVSLKPWPSCRHLHGTLTAVIDGLVGQDIAFADVAEVVVHVGKINLDRSRPVALGLVPKQRIDLLCNMTFAVAAAVRHRGLPLALYRDGALADDVVRMAAPKVRVVYDPRQDGPWSLEPGLVEIKTTGGTVHVIERRLALGHPDNPMSVAQQRAKFLDCAATAARPVAPERAREIMAMVDRLEAVADMRQLAALLA